MEAITTALTTGIAGLGEDVLGVAVVVIPVALTIWGAILGIKYAKKFFGAVSK